MQKVKKKLYLFTNSFPYGKGEKPFVAPELDALRHEFDVTIVSHASQDEFEDVEWISRLPDEVEVLHYSRPSDLILCILGLGILFTPVGRQEIVDLLRDGLTGGRFREALATYANAVAKLRFYKKSRLFDDEENSLFYSFWLNDQNLALAMAKEEKPRIKLVSRAHRYDLYNEASAGGRQAFQRYKKKMTDKIIFLTEEAKLYFEKNFGAFRNENDFEVVALGTEERGNQPPSGHSDYSTIVSCSNLVPVKRVELIAQALAKISYYRINWVHFGDGECRNGLLDYCKMHNVAIDWKGHSDNADIYAYYQNNYVDMFVTTSASEGSPVSIQEALSFGIPIVGTDVGGVGEQIDGNGILLTSNPTVAEVAHAIESMIGRSSNEIEVMRSRSKEIWKEKFDSTKSKKKLISVLRGM